MHAERYLELASMVFDLQPFIPFLSAETKQEIVATLEAKVSEIENPLRKARAVISLYKLRKVFGFIDGNLIEVKAMYEEYLRILELDGKPEKGERKLADDLVILINEVLEPLTPKQ